MNDLIKIDFHGATLLAIPGTSAETTMIAMKPLFEGAGVPWEAQRQRIIKHPVLAASTLISQVETNVGPRETLFLPLDKVDFALATLHPDRVKDAKARANLILYQTEACRALYAHFQVAQGPRKPITLRDLGGVVKAVTMKAIAESEARMIERMADMDIKFSKIAEGFDATITRSIFFKATNDILIDAGVNSKGRRALTQRCSKLLNKMAIMEGRQKEVRCSPDKDRKFLFHVDLARDWLKGEGAMIIRSHKDTQEGQAVLKLVPPTKRRKSGKSA